MANNQKMPTEYSMYTSFDINTISNIINGDDKHDISNNNTKIGIYTFNHFNESWYIFCDKIYIEDNQVMETTIERWKNISTILIILLLLST